MLKFIPFLMILFVMNTTIAGAKSVSELQAEVNLDMCRSTEHQFSFDLANCTYCAQGLHLNEATSKCDGSLNVIGKCYGDDHFHAATQQCMYCAKGYVFNEEIKSCIEVSNTKE